jgi:hypothetical protein
MLTFCTVYARIHETRLRRGVTTHRSALAAGAEESRAQASTGAVEQSHRGETQSGSFLRLKQRSNSCAIAHILWQWRYMNQVSWKALCRDKLLSTQLSVVGEKAVGA